MCTFRKSKQMPESERKNSHGFSFSCVSLFKVPYEGNNEFIKVKSLS
jgi:hypothetical protein